MTSPIHCQSCGEQQDLPEDYARPQFRCTDCGAINNVPQDAANLRPMKKDVIPAAAVFDLFKSDSPQSKSVSSPGTAPQPSGERELLLQGTDNEEDVNPSTVRGDVPTAKCPECGKPIHEGVSICKHCGVDFVAKRKAERAFPPVDRTWDNGWPLQRRIMLFVILQIINLAVLIAPLFTEQAAGLYWSGAIISAALQAFLLGTFDRLHLTRNARGKVVLTQTWRVAFVTMPPKKIRWQEHEGVRLITSDEFDPFDWMMAVILFCYAIVPGIVFWWYVIRPDKFDVALCKDHGHPATLLCRTINHARAQELATVIAEVVVLPVLP